MNRINNKVKKLTIDQVNLKDKIVLVRETITHLESKLGKMIPMEELEKLLEDQ